MTNPLISHLVSAADGTFPARKALIIFEVNELDGKVIAKASTKLLNNPLVEVKRTAKDTYDITFHKELRGYFHDKDGSEMKKIVEKCIEHINKFVAENGEKKIDKSAMKRKTVPLDEPKLKRSKT